MRGTGWIGRHKRARAEAERLRRQRDRARQRVQRLLGRLERSQGLLEQANALDVVRRDELASLQRRLDDTSDERNVWRWRFEELERDLAAREQRLAEGRGALFDYAYLPSPRDFSAPQRRFFADLVSRGDDDYAELTARLAKHLGPLQELGVDEPADEATPYWHNNWFPPLDGMTLYAMVAELDPKLYVEVGSGNSTKFVRQAIRDHGLRTRVVSIDPEPRTSINELCDEVVRTRFEHMDLSLLDRLEDGDMLFVDNSHRSFTASDVTVFFTEALPYLAPGVFWGLHDTFLPLDYPESWNERFYNEQYLLMCYLLGGAAGDEIVLPVHHLRSRPDALAPLLARWPEVLPQDDENIAGGSFWMRRGGRPEVSAS